MPKRRADKCYVEQNIGMSRSHWTSRKTANCILDSKVFTIKDVGNFIFRQERNVKELPPRLTQPASKSQIL